MFYSGLFAPALKLFHIEFSLFLLDLVGYMIEIKALALEYFKFKGNLGDILVFLKN